ncbi:MAG TPA: AarF/UbiB family protein [Casimicrobiaceae bacterium]|nr:AarF/UbiB family protein [Casimicrobiaceae bacterium]
MKLEHLKLYRDVALLLVRFGRADIVRQSGLAADLGEPLPEPGGDLQVPVDIERLAHEVERLGPTFIKLGQLLSTRPDILPPAYAEALTRLQDDCAPFPGEEARAIVEEELGVRMSKLFERFDIEPVAAASTAQVHYARLRDGREVAVKVQRPGIRARVESDLEALADVAAFFERSSELGRKFDVAGLVREFRRTLLRELDFREEAGNLVLLSQNLIEFTRIVVPQPVSDYSTSRVLTMQFVHGRKVTALSPLARLELDGMPLADELFRAYLKQMLSDGFFHADPHPGNVFLVDAHRLALIDLGMVARIAPPTQERLLQLTLALIDRRPDDAARVLLQAGVHVGDVDEPAFRREIFELVSRLQDAQVKDIQLGRFVLEMTRVAMQHGIRLPGEFALIGKALLNLDQIARTLAPEFDPNEAMRRHAAGIVEQRFRRDLSLGGLFQGALETRNLVHNLPGRLNTILGRMADNEFRLRIDAFEEETLMTGLQKVANRIATGLVLAALIVGAAMLMDIPSPYTILGYPAIAILLFFTAAGGGLVMLGTIFANDVRARRRRRPAR